MREKEILSAVYEQLENELPPTLKYEKMQNSLISKTNKFLQVIGEQNREELEELYDIIYAMGKEESKRFFYEGFSFPIRLFLEVVNKD